MLLTSEGILDGNDGMFVKMEQREPSLCHTETEARIAAQIALTTKQMVAKVTLTHFEESLDDILQCAYESARTAVRSGLYKVVEQVLFYFLRRGVSGETLDGYVSTYFNIGNTDDKAGKKLLSINYAMAPISKFIQRRTGEAIAAERVATKMEDHLNVHKSDTAVKYVK